MIPICSVIIPAFNAEKYICEAIDSVLAQECDFDYEIIVVDDGSTDRTSEVVRGYGEKVRLIQKENGGPGSARNAGVLAAQSDIIVLLDADDKAMPGRLAFQTVYMLNNPGVKLTFGNIIMQTDPASDKLSQKGFEFSDGFRLVENSYSLLLLKGSYIQNTTVAIRKDTLFEIGGYREDIFVAEDYSLWCKIARKHAIAYTSRRLSWLRRENHGNLTASKHIFLGPALVLFENLSKFDKELSNDEYDSVLSEFRLRSDWLMRYEWAFNGRKAMKMRLAQFRSLLTNRFVAKWLLISLLPSSFGRLVKRLLNSMNLTMYSLQPRKLGLLWIRLRGHAPQPKARKTKSGLPAPRERHEIR